MPITRGSTPATALPTNEPSGSMPSSRAFASEAITSAAAPSLMPAALPAVTVPPARNAGFSAPSFSSDVSGRGCSSRTTSPTGDDLLVEAARPRRRPPSGGATRARTRPGPRARRRSARRRSRRSRPSTRAGTSPPSAGSGSASRDACRTSSWLPRGNALSGFATANGARDIDSTPPATKRSPSPADDRVARADDRAEARRAEPVDRDAGDRLRKPGEERAHARDVPVVLARLVRAAEPHVLDLGRGNARALDDLADARAPRGRRGARRRARRRSARSACGCLRGRRRLLTPPIQPQRRRRARATGARGPPASPRRRSPASSSFTYMPMKRSPRSTSMPRPKPSA